MNLKDNEMLRCPRCGGRKFGATAHVTQDWEIDEKGVFLRSMNNHVETTHYPDEDDIIDCVICGYSSAGSDFIAKDDNATVIRSTVRSKYPCAVISVYSWENGGPVVLFRDENEAKKYLRAVFEAEAQSDKEGGKTIQTEISEEGDYAKITVSFQNGEEDITEWILRSDIYSPAGETEPPSDAEILLRTGEFLLPGDKVLVSVPAYRMWGGRCREDTKAPPVDVAGIVLNTNIDRDENTGELTFTCSVAASVPIADTDREYYGTFDIPMGLCTKVEVVEGYV